MNVTTVPIILTVGRTGRAFFSGPVNGGVRSHNLKLSKKFIYVFNFLTHIKRKSTHMNANCIYMSTLPNLYISVTWICKIKK